MNSIARAIILVLFFGGLLAADQPEPVQIGGPCVDAGQLYNLTSDITKTPWRLNDLFAVPIGTLSPESWVLSASFGTQFQAELQSDDSAGFAHACTAIWGPFFQEPAQVIFTVRRTITATHHTLQCSSGYWVSLSTQPIQMTDISDWLTAPNGPFDVADDASQAALQNDLQGVLDSLNAQPGASSDSE